MSTQYPILDNRPINKWKVAELKEELKRRNLPIKGLKDDLVKRLDEAIRIEREAITAEEGEGFTGWSEPVGNSGDAKISCSSVQMVNDPLEHCGNEDYKVDEFVTGMKIVSDRTKVDQGIDLEQEANLSTVPITMESTLVEVPPAETDVQDEVVLPHISSSSSKGVLDKNDVAEDNKVPDSPQKDALLSGELGNKDDKVDEAATGMNIDSDSTKVDQGIGFEQGATLSTVPITMIGESALVEAPQAETNIQNEVVLPPISSSKGVLDKNEVFKDNKVSDSPQKDALLSGELGISEASLQSSGEAVNSHVVSSVGTLEEKNGKTRNNEDEGTDLPPEKAVENEEVKPENISLKSSQVDAVCDEPCAGDQVYEVSPNLGFQVKSESFSTDILTVNEKKELKDNLNADNVQLEPEIVRQEMVQPSPSRDPPGDGNLHPLDDLVPHRHQTLDGETNMDQSKNLETSNKNDSADKFSVDVSVVEHNLASETTKKVASDNELNQIFFAKDTSPVSGLSPEKLEPSAEEKSDAAATVEESKPLDHNDFTKMTDVADGELQEKVNFDQSSADDSMEEDTSETRHVESDHNSIKVDEKTELDKEPNINEGGRIDVVVQHLTPSDKWESSNEHEDGVAALSEKRKFQDAIEAGNQEPPKRQRRWNTESQHVPESQRSVASLSTRTKASHQTASTRFSLNSSNSTLSEEAPKERPVPPSQKTPTTSLRIDHFLRPFTLKAVQELLAKSGKVCSFWMDHIKTHCYVTYSSAEEAIETRNAVYNLQWPPNGGRHLIADFVDPEEVKLRVEAPSQTAAASVNTSTSALKSPTQPRPPPTHQQGPMNQERQHPLSRQPPVRDPSTAREKLARAPAPVPEKIDPPIITLDDLFRKTRATPRIYYLPLTDEQVAAKLARQKRGRQ